MFSSKLNIDNHCHSDNVPPVSLDERQDSLNKVMDNVCSNDTISLKQLILHISLRALDGILR